MFNAATALATLAASTAPHNRRHGVGVGIVLLLVIVGVGYYLWRRNRMTPRGRR